MLVITLSPQSFGVFESAILNPLELITSHYLYIQNEVVKCQCSQPLYPVRSCRIQETFVIKGMTNATMRDYVRSW